MFYHFPHSSVLMEGFHYNYSETVSVWYQLFIFLPIEPPPQPESDHHSTLPQDGVVMITSSEKEGSVDTPIVIVNDNEGEGQGEEQGVHGEDSEVIGAFSGIL